MTKRKDSGVEIPSTSRETTKNVTQRRSLEVPSAKLLVVKDVGYPFRLKGDPLPVGLEIDSDELFADYAREQWIGSIVKKGSYLFDRYVMPDFAFQVTKVVPEEAIVSKKTKISVDSTASSTTFSGRPINLEDVIGHENVKKKCRLILKYLKNPEMFGEWAPRSVLFHGLPGTGKTLTARAVAQEANARIFMTKASALIGVHVGDGGRRISSIFGDARKHSPSILFIDELDAIGLARSFQSIRGDVSEVVTALLGEMDSIGEGSGVVVIGATNALPLIDPAIRSRFDTVFEFSLPKEDERFDILELYSSRLPLPIEADLRSVAKMTKGLSGRDLRDRVLKEALHIAISDDESTITRNIVMRVLDKITIKNLPDYTI